MVEADRVGEQFIVIFGVGQDRQHTDLVHQPAECRLVRLELAVVAAQGVADACHFQAAAPDVTHLLFDDF